MSSAEATVLIPVEALSVLTQHGSDPERMAGIEEDCSSFSSQSLLIPVNPEGIALGQTRPEESKEAAADFYYGSSVQLDSIVDSPEAVVIKVAQRSLWKAKQDFLADFEFYKMETKIHRFPPGLRALGDRYIVPTVVAIGPYHRDLPSLQEMAKVKDVAAHHFINHALDISPTYVYKKIYDEFRPVAAKARSSYARDAVAGIEDAEFVGMIFRDACFLLQYMLCMSSSLGCQENFDVNPSLRRFFFSNRACIDTDVMLLENQLPWTVLDALSKFSTVKMEDFVAEMGNRFQITEDIVPKSFILDPDMYTTPPHLLGLLRFYLLGRRKAPELPVPDDGFSEDGDGQENEETEAAHDQVSEDSDEPEHKETEAAHGQVSDEDGDEEENKKTELAAHSQVSDEDGDGPEDKETEAAAHGQVGEGGRENKKTGHGHGLMKVSVSNAIELAEIGVRLKPSKTADFMDMGMKKGAFWENLFSGNLSIGNLFLAPLSLDSTKACCLVNMAAFEVCTVSRFQEDVQKTAVCSYIALFAMLMDREEDVHRLRSRKLLHGNYTNKEMLDFFNSLAKHLPDGGYKFARIMADIESYKRGCFRRILIKVYKFLYRNWKTIAAVLSLLGAIAGIMKAVLSI